MRVLFLWTILFVSLTVGAAPGDRTPDYGPWEMNFYPVTGGFGTSVPRILLGRAPHKAAFLVFATEFEVAAPEATVRAMKILREKHGLPLHGIWIETQHIRAMPNEVRNLIAIAEANGFYTMVRVPTGNRENLQGYLGTGVSGIVVPVTETPEQVREAFVHSFYSAGREMGFEPDTQNLQGLSSEELYQVDRHKTLAFMIESVKGVEAIESGILFRELDALIEQYGSRIQKKQIVFWFGPYDGKKDRARLVEKDILKQDMDAAGVWWGEKFPAVAEAVHSAGYSVGGHMATFNSGVLLANVNHFSIFTIPGIADSFGNPAIPSTGTLFKDVAPGEKMLMLRDPVLLPEERETLLRLAEQIRCVAELGENKK